MKNSFLLFGEMPFDAFADQHFNKIATEIGRMSDTEVLLYKESFPELVALTLKCYVFPELHISFDDKLVDLVGKPGYRETRYFAEYSLVVKGDTRFLGLSPYNSGYRPVDLPVLLRGNFISFDIDTCYHLEELTPEVTARVKHEYDRIKRFITSTERNLNSTIEFYNAEIKQFIVKHLASKMRQAERSLAIRKTLDFK
jgi:hypothetical protein